MLRTSSFTGTDKLVYNSFSVRKQSAFTCDSSSTRSVADVDRSNSVSVCFKPTLLAPEVVASNPVVFGGVSAFGAHLAGVLGFDRYEWNGFDGGFIFHKEAELSVGNPIDNFPASLRPLGFGFPQILQILYSDGSIVSFCQSDYLVHYLVKTGGYKVSLPTRQVLQLLPTSLRVSVISMLLDGASPLLESDLTVSDVLSEIQLLNYASSSRILDCDCDVSRVHVDTQYIRHWFQFKLLLDKNHKLVGGCHLDGCYTPSFLKMLLESSIRSVNSDGYSNTFSDGPQGEYWSPRFGFTQGEKSVVKGHRNTLDVGLVLPIIPSETPSIDSRTNDELRGDSKAFTKVLVSFLVKTCSRMSLIYKKNVKALQNHLRVSLSRLRKKSTLNLGQFNRINNQRLNNCCHNISCGSQLKNTLKGVKWRFLSCLKTGVSSPQLL